MLQFTAFTTYIVLTGFCVFFAVKLTLTFRRFRMRILATDVRTLQDLPSVSVCIPARNETHAMTECLERVVASTYPKLEIIVLDDSSVDDTSVLIKSFAHAGVRFVEGSPCPEGWLGKNHALETLRKEASGTFILYMDVDTQIEPDTIGQLVAYIAHEKADMTSILPLRMDNWRLSVIFSGLRYFWTLILHTRATPAVASNAWLVNRQVLDQSIGGFEKHRLDVQPEAHVAAQLVKSNTYRFLVSTPLLGLSYEKRYSSFVETNIRVLYPMSGGTFMTGGLGLLVLLVLCSPLFILSAGLVSGWTLYQTIALWQLLLFGGIYAVYLSYVWRRGWWLGLILWPVALLQDTVLFVMSILKYSTGTVTWKGRPVAPPRVAHIVEQ